MKVCRVIFTALAVVLFAIDGRAQIITGSITGQVTDGTGAVVGKVQITAHNTGTGIATRAESEENGTYVVPDLQAGTYEIIAEHAGFRTSRLEGIQLQASQTLRVNVGLQLGDIKQTIEVQAEAPQINTESPQIGESITSKQMNDLPFAQQSIDGLFIMTPGAQIASGSWSSPVSGGATRWGSTNFTINGTQANDIGNGAGAYSYNLGLVSLPALQSLQEFKVDSFNTSAEYRAVGTVTMVTKAGSNAFHGGAYEFNQNKDFNANTFLNNAQSISRSPFVRNQFGGNVGGPIVRNKAFFFFDYTGLRNRNYSQVRATLPSAAMRSGDFSALCSTYTAGVCTDSKGTQLYNPYTALPFLNNQIPTAMITSQAQTLLKYLPATTSATTGLPNGSPNYFGLVSTAQNLNAVDLRLDYHVSDKDTLYGVYTHNVGSPFQVALGTPPNYGNASDYGYKTFGYSMVETHTFSPSALNDLRLSWFDHPNIRSGQNLDFNPQTLFPQLTTSPNRGLPTMTIGGYTGMFTDTGRGYYSHAFDMELNEHFTLIHGRHTMKFGFESSTYKTYGPNPNAPLGSFTFTGQWTGNKGNPNSPQSQGNAFADFLIGTANSSTTGTAGVFESVYYCWDNEFYVQDSWQVSPKLTLDYGLRYMYQTPWWWQGNYSTYWNPSTNQLALPENSATATLPTYGASAAQFAAYNFTTTQALGINQRYMIPDKNNWAPRFGFAYRPFNNDRTVIRAGYGVYYNFNPSYAGSRDDVLSPPWLGGLGGFASQTYTSQIPGKPTTTYLPDITFANPFPSALATVSGVSAHPTIYSIQRDFKNAVSQQWSLTTEHQFSNTWSARASYLGSQTHHIQWFFGDLNIPTVQIPNVPTQNQRPYQPWGSILSTRSGGKQNFEQMQLELNKRYANGLSFQAQYQWTRSLDDVDVSGGPQIPAYPALDYGNSTYIRRQQLVFNYIYELPFGQGRHWLSNMNKVGQAFAGGWEVSGITTYAGGLPFSVKFAVPSNYIGWQGGRADQVGSNLYTGQQSGSHDIVDGVQWFNVSAFAPPQPWQWGNSARNVVWGPGMSNWDMSAQKWFPITERVKLQVRGDFLDAFNHFNLGTPNSTIADTRDGGTANATAGKIYGGSGSRVIQLGAKIVF